MHKSPLDSYIIIYILLFKIQTLFILQQVQNRYKKVIQLILIMLMATVLVVIFVWEEPEYPEETHLSDLLTT